MNLILRDDFRFLNFFPKGEFDILELNAPNVHSVWTKRVNKEKKIN